MSSGFYENEIAPCLPPEILDFHAHIWSSDNWKFKPWETGADGGKYMVVTENYSPQQLLHDGRMCFPDRNYNAVVFGYPTPAADIEKDTQFVADAAQRHDEFYPLMLAGKSFNTPREQLEERLRDGNFLGYKVFLDWMGDDYGDVRVEDMLSDNEMALADDLGLVVLLHVPRSGRLADPEIQRGVQWLSREYPKTRIVLAHCGRCYLPSQISKAVDSIRNLDNVFLDTSMVMDPLVLQILMETIGPQRLLYATDFPVAAMTGRRVRVMDHWVDVVLDEYPDSANRVKSGSIQATYMAL